MNSFSNQIDKIDIIVLFIQFFKTDWRYQDFEVFELSIHRSYVLDHHLFQLNYPGNFFKVRTYQ